MNQKKISGGFVHDIPSDLRKALLTDENVRDRWESLTPLARNEWICWTISVKKLETRQNHIIRTAKELLEGKRRPCCWPGCSHRQKK